VSATFDEIFPTYEPATVAIGTSAFVLRGFAVGFVPDLLPALDACARRSDYRHMSTPGGDTMSVAMTNCGRLGWITDRHGYRYSDVDPLTGQSWPAMPAILLRLATCAAAEAGFVEFVPDACLMNRYAPGSRLSLHQDRDETDFDAPIVSVSLGMAAVFLFGGHQRSDKPARIPLVHGDVVVWGREDRLRFHGVMPIKTPPHPLLGNQRINLTCRKAG
jgi:alkylated DNA repair protein (DNA oxidative demethylase)